MTHDAILVITAYLLLLPAILAVMGKDARKEMYHDLRTAPRWWWQQIRTVRVRIVFRSAPASRISRFLTRLQRDRSTSRSTSRPATVVPFTRLTPTDEQALLEALDRFDGVRLVSQPRLRRIKTEVH